jgi:hypothetical protein
MLAWFGLNGDITAGKIIFGIWVVLALVLAIALAFGLGVS